MRRKESIVIKILQLLLVKKYIYLASKINVVKNPHGSVDKQETTKAI
jgi:hypothetical protein